MVHGDPPANDFALIFVELGATIIGLAVLARVASRWGIFPSHFTCLLVSLSEMAASYTSDSPKASFRSEPKSGYSFSSSCWALSTPANNSTGTCDATCLLARLTLYSTSHRVSSPVCFLVGSRCLRCCSAGSRLFRLRASSLECLPNSEVSILLRHPPCSPFWYSKIEDLVMAVYLPLVAVLIAGGGAAGMFVSIAIAAGTVNKTIRVADEYARLTSIYAADTPW